MEKRRRHPQIQVTVEGQRGQGRLHDEPVGRRCPETLAADQEEQHETTDKHPGPPRHGVRPAHEMDEQDQEEEETAHTGLPDTQPPETRWTSHLRQVLGRENGPKRKEDREIVRQLKPGRRQHQEREHSP